MIIDKKVSIRFVNLTKQFNSFTAVNNLSFDIYQGEVMGFLGPNGAGKSTTMKMMADLLHPTSGEVWIRNNEDLIKVTDFNKDQMMNKMGFLIETPVFYDNVTPRQILTYFARLKGYPPYNVSKRVETVVMMVGMLEWIDKELKTFSKGMVQKIGIAAAIVHDPDIVILDEPHVGLDPKARKEVRAIIMKLKELGKTIFLSSHLLFEISEVADRIAIINKGTLIALDSLENLEAQVKRSVIKIEFIQPIDPMESESIINQIRTSIQNYNLNVQEIKFNPENSLIELLFDGKRENQYQILKSLIDHGFQIIDYSVPKANLLEDLYLNLVTEPEQNNQKIQQEIKPTGAFIQ